MALPYGLARLGRDPAFGSDSGYVPVSVEASAPIE